MHAPKFCARLGLLTVLMAATTVSFASAATRTHVIHHACGVYMYHHNGKCVDARNRPASEWGTSMTSRPVW
jgi:Spy/CpxP family protein refolding chaperone